ncbi:MAG: T9SS type A sorting domain-containing protein [Bacteroidia bacterium]
MRTSILLFCTILFSFSFSLTAQSFQWAKKEGNQTNGKKITTDDAGNSYVYGEIFATTTVGGQNLDPANGDYFIIKYDNAGAVVWVKQLDSMEVSDIASTNTDVFLTGRFGTGASFAGTPVAGGSGWDGFVARVSASGSLVWVETLTNAGSYESVNSLALDGGGNIYVTGVYRGATATMGTTMLTGNYGLESMFLIKMASDGNITWTQSVTSDDGSASGGSVSVAPSGNIYVMSTAFGDSVYYGSMYYYAGPYEAELLVHYNSSGTALDFIEINHISQDNVTDMYVDGNSNVYTLQTNYLTSYTLAKYSPALDTIWVLADGMGGHLSVGEIEINQAGQVIVVGDVGEAATFGNTTTVQAGVGFLAYYTPTGTFISVKQIPGSSVFMRSASRDSSDNIYITGTFTDTVNFDGIELIATGVNASFVAKYGFGSTGLELTTLTEENISIYPNPCSSGLLTCEVSKSAGEVNVELYNVTGEKIYQGRLNEELNQIDLSGKAAGMYMVNISTQNKVVGKRIVLN